MAGADGGGVRHLLLELGDGKLKALPSFPLSLQLLLKLRSLGLRPLQTHTQLRQLQPHTDTHKARGGAG